MPSAQIFLMGAPRIVRDGTVAPLDTRKAMALVAYLAVTAVPQRRDSLAALLWPDHDQESARGALRRTLSTLTKALGGAGLEAEREQIAVKPVPDLWIDLWEFESKLSAVKDHGHDPGQLCLRCISDLERCAELYGGHFMEGFALRDSPPFDDWQYAQAERLRHGLAGALHGLATAHMTSGAVDVAISTAQRWVQLDPMQEQAQRALMMLYAAAGQRASALRQYRECVRVLDQELGVSPLPETTELYESIREGKLVALARPEPPLPAISDRRADRAVTTPKRLLGRSDELAALKDAYATAGQGAAVVAIEGEAGIGKTTLVEALLAEVAAQGGVTLTAQCYPNQVNVAYAPVAEALRAGASLHPVALSGVPERSLVEAARLVPELAQSLNTDRPTEEREEGPAAQF
ncbi:MAG: BTAD domain-containing putative transcriptional regulator, partial [Dehalococcoidia bacterium]